jgi:hypothetical protein
MEWFPSFVPRPIRGLLLEAVLIGMLLLPFIAGAGEPTARARRTMMMLGALLLAGWLLFSWYGYRFEAHR